MTAERLSKEKPFAAFLYHRRGVQRENKATDWQRKPITRNQLKVGELSSITHLRLPTSFPSIVPEGSHTLQVPSWICDLKHIHQKNQKQNSKLMIGVNVRIFLESVKHLLC